MVNSILKQPRKLNLNFIRHSCTHYMEVGLNLQRDTFLERLKWQKRIFQNDIKMYVATYAFNNWNRWLQQNGQPLQRNGQWLAPKNCTLVGNQTNHSGLKKVPKIVEGILEARQKKIITNCATYTTTIHSCPTYQLEVDLKYQCSTYRVASKSFLPGPLCS